MKKKELWKRLGVSLMSISLVVSGIPAGAAQTASAAAKDYSILLDGNDIRTENVNGLTWKGFGLLSANSTSDLLMDYKSQNPEAYAELLQYLFGGKYPLINHVKLEMGNDRNTSTGSEAATKRYEDEPANVLRCSGWQLAADAKKINPDVKISILRWREPGWVNTNEQYYQWYKETILEAYQQYGFMVDYVNPNTNEYWGGDYDVERTKLFSDWIDREDDKSIPDDTARALFQKIKLVVGDEASTVSVDLGNRLRKDLQAIKQKAGKDVLDENGNPVYLYDGRFFNAVDVVGYHYSPSDDKNDTMKWLADTADKEVWNSEAQATFSNSAFRPSNNVKDPSVAGTGIGGTGSALEMGNTFIKGFVQSRRTHVIYQPAIGSFYEGGQYSFKELVSARDPWSGWMHYDAGLLVLAHVNKFAVTGWENEDNTAGIWRGVPQASKSTAEGINPVNGRNGEENYMTLASPAKDGFSTVIVNDSEYPMTYRIQTKNMKLKADQKLAVWETRAADDGAFNENYLKHIKDVSKDAKGNYVVTVKPYSIVTVTTLDVADSEEHTKALPVEGERTVLDTDATGDVQDVDSEYLYADDFAYEGKTVPVLDGKGGFTDEKLNYIDARGGDTGAMARYIHNIQGRFETYKTEDGNYVLRQQYDKKSQGLTTSWNSGDANAAIGDFRWMNYTAEVDVLFETEETEKEKDMPYGMLAIRQTGGGGDGARLERASGYTLKVKQTGAWELYRRKDVVASGDAPEGFKKGANVWNHLKLEGAENVIRGYINDELVVTYEDEQPITSGRIGLGCAYTFTQFDNLKVTKIDGYAPYYAEYLDNMETYDLTTQKNARLIYSIRNWNHANGKGMFVYQRSMSESTAADAKMKYTFTGTGFDILAGTGNTAKIRVIVDDKMITQLEETYKAEDMNAIYSLAGLEYGKHTMRLEVVEGTLSIDAIGIIGKVYGDAYKGTCKKQWTQASPENPEDFEEKKPQTPTPTPSPTPEETVKKGTKLETKTAKYCVSDVKKKTVEYVAPKKTSVTSASIPDTVKVTLNGKEVSFKVTAIQGNAFAKCKKLKSVTIGKNVTKINANAFKGCSKLKKITIKSTGLKSVGKNAIKGIHKKAVIKAPKSKVAKYKKLFKKKTGFGKKMKVK